MTSQSRVETCDKNSVHDTDENDGIVVSRQTQRSKNEACSPIGGRSTVAGEGSVSLPSRAGGRYCVAEDDSGECMNILVRFLRPRLLSANMHRTHIVWSSLFHARFHVLLSSLLELIWTFPV